MARLARIGGEVVLTGTVDDQGRVLTLSAVSGPPILRPVASAWVQTWRFKPADQTGRLIQVRVLFRFSGDESTQSFQRLPWCVTGALPLPDVDPVITTREVANDQ